MNRKCIVLSILLLCLLHIQSNAQTIKNFGAKIGLNSSGTTLKNIENQYQFDIQTGKRNGFNAALFVEWEGFGSQYLSVITAIQYSKRGFSEEIHWVRENFSSEVTIMRAKTRLDYISIPGLFKFYYPLEHFTPYLLFGPRFDLLISIKPETYENIPSDWLYESNESLWASNLLKSSYGSTLGIGLQLESILPTPILLEFCYNFDLSDNYPESVESKNSSLDFWVGIIF